MNTSREMQQMIAARTALLLDQPFFGVLALRLKLKEDTSNETAWVDGVTLGFNPAFTSALSPAERIGLIAHEVLHCACGHPWRQDGRDHKRWNIACDYAINPIIVDAKMSIPADGLIDASYTGKAAEWIYARLPNGSQNGQNGSQQGQGQPGQGQGQPGQGQGQGQPPSSSQGEVRPAPVSGDAADTAADWQLATEQSAKMAQAMGKLPGSLARSAANAVKPNVDWRSVLRRFLQATSRADYTWSRPNTRYLGRGLFLPSLRSEAMGPLAIAVDTSGSIDATTLATFSAEINAIVAEVNPESVTVLYCDAQVNHIDRYETGEPVTLSAHGGGGTDFRPVFDAIAAGDADTPIAVIYLTDLYGSFPDTEPDYPVLWACTSSQVAPFGETVAITE